MGGLTRSEVRPTMTSMLQSCNGLEEVTLGPSPMLPDLSPTLKYGSECSFKIHFCLYALLSSSESGGEAPVISSTPTWSR